MSICPECFYYSRTRYGVVCGFDGTYNPSKRECQNFKSRAQAEAEGAKSIELTKLLLSVIDRLVELQPEIEKMEDKKLRERLMEVCLVAKQVKKALR